MWRRPMSEDPRRGFTLIEVMVVIVILGLIAGFAVPQLARAITQAKITRAVSDFRIIEGAAQRMFGDLGVYPAEGPWCVGAGFVNLTDVPAAYQSSWKGPYLKRWPLQHAFGGCVTYLQARGCGFADSDGVVDNDSYVHFMDAGPFTDAIKQNIDRILDDGVLTTGVVRQCRGGLAYLLGEGPIW